MDRSSRRASKAGVWINAYVASGVRTAGEERRHAHWRVGEFWWLCSGSGMSASYVRHPFDDTCYVRRERVPAGEMPPGAPHLTGEHPFDMDIRLAPRD